MPPPSAIGRALKRLRVARGWTQQEVADRAGVTDAYIAMIETGVRHSPSLAVLRRLAKTLGVPVATLVEG
jgi:transcriptional regulator with XRE-family HTH domain